MNDPRITIFTDGSSRGNPGPGGWGSVVVTSDHVTELGGHEEDTTNNRMELSAAIGGLKNVQGPLLRSFGATKGKQDPRSKVQKTAQIVVYTDSSYVINGITKWVKGWKRNDWKTKTKDDVLNRGLWEELDALNLQLKAEWKYVGGHVGILGNERCDHIATAFADDMEIELYDGPRAGYDLPNILDISLDQTRQTKKSSDSSHSRAKAYSYVSMVNGVIETHHSWPECEKRVKGARGARYKKSISSEDEAQIIAEFEAV